MALIDTQPEPVGVNCAAGGTAVRVGVDRDGSGTLEAGEIEQTSYVCQPGVTGPPDDDVQIQGSVMRSAARPMRAATPGCARCRATSRWIDLPTSTRIELPALERVQDMWLNNDVTFLIAPLLREARVAFGPQQGLPGAAWDRPAAAPAESGRVMGGAGPQA